MYFALVVMAVLVVAGCPAGDNSACFEPSGSTLRTLGAQRKIAIGTVVSLGPLSEQDECYIDALTREFDTLIIDQHGFMTLHPEPDRYDFDTLDAFVGFAQARDLRIYGPHLTWHKPRATPKWMLVAIVEKDTGKEWAELTREEIIEVLRSHVVTEEERNAVTQLLESHVKAVVGRYRGKVGAWNVVNEAIEDEGRLDPESPLRESFWFKMIGPKYIKLAFQAAREADPDALLLLNDFDVEGAGPKADAFYNVAKALKERDIPIDAVGFQMHIELEGYPSPRELRVNMRRFAKLGLDVHITEMDVRIKEPATPADLETQASRYATLLSACLAEPNCKSFMTWGLSDKDSWIPSHFPGYGTALLFDESYAPKPAYYAVRDTLR